jgi:dTMP kinase
MPFITFEGGEGCGKTTQSKLLFEALASNGIEVVHTREPGGTPGAEILRKLLVEGGIDKWDSKTELLLHYAARREHTENLIKPALNIGKTVICDRFLDSTIAYQGYAQGIELSEIRTLHELIIGNLCPDITFILDLDVILGLGRAKGRGAESNNRYENMDITLHQRVRQGFLEIASADPARCVIIDATLPIEEVHFKIIDTVNKVFDLKVKKHCT